MDFQMKNGWAIESKNKIKASFRYRDEIETADSDSFFQVNSVNSLYL